MLVFADDKPEAQWFDANYFEQVSRDGFKGKAALSRPQLAQKQVR